MLGYVFQKIKLKHFFVFTILIILFLFLAQIILITTWASNSQENKENLPIILYWTPFIAEQERIIHCYNEYKCLLTKNRNYLNLTEVFLFYGSFFNVSDLPLPKEKPWALFHEESPRNVAIFLNEKTFELFEIAATFSRNSDFPLTFQYLENLNSILNSYYLVDLDHKNSLLDSISPVLFIQSDCDTPNKRESYISELMKFIKIDSYGSCLKNKPSPKELTEIDPLDLFNKKLIKFIAKYKFVIAFENAICEDYITEKLWRPLMAGTIPIYFGSPSVQDWLPNKKSAILAKDFKGPKELAQFLHELNNDDNLYNQYLQHKKPGYLIENEKLKKVMSRGNFGLDADRDHPIPAFECYICKRVHEKKLELTRKNHVYECPVPPNRNSWEYFWQKGKCQGEELLNFVREEKSGRFIDNCWTKK